MGSDLRKLDVPMIVGVLVCNIASRLVIENMFGANETVYIFELGIFI